MIALKIVNVETGAITDVANTGQTWIVLAWDGVAKVARVIAPPYSPVGGAAAPKLGTIDLCTGVITAGPAITVEGTQVRRAEGLAQDPATGTFYITVGRTGTTAATEYITDENGTVDIATGAVTIHGAHTTLQNAGDILMVAGSTLHLLDVATGTNTGMLYTLDKTTGIASAPLTTGATTLRVAYDPTREVVFTGVGTGAPPSASARSIGKLNLVTGASTPLGTVLAEGTYGGQQFNGLISVPPPKCN